MAPRGGSKPRDLRPGSRMKPRLNCCRVLRSSTGIPPSRQQQEYLPLGNTTKKDGGDTGEMDAWLVNSWSLIWVTYMQAIAAIPKISGGSVKRWPTRIVNEVGAMSEEYGLCSGWTVFRGILVLGPREFRTKELLLESQWPSSEFHPAPDRIWTAHGPATDHHTTLISQDGGTNEMFILTWVSEEILITHGVLGPFATPTRNLADSEARFDSGPDSKAKWIIPASPPLQAAGLPVRRSKSDLEVDDCQAGFISDRYVHITQSESHLIFLRVEQAESSLHAGGIEPTDCRNRNRASPIRLPVKPPTAARAWRFSVLGGDLHLTSQTLTRYSVTPCLAASVAGLVPRKLQALPDPMTKGGLLVPIQMEPHLNGIHLSVSATTDGRGPQERAVKGSHSEVQKLMLETLDWGQADRIFRDLCKRGRTTRRTPVWEDGELPDLEQDNILAYMGRSLPPTKTYLSLPYNDSPKARYKPRNFPGHATLDTISGTPGGSCKATALNRLNEDSPDIHFVDESSSSAPEAGLLSDLGLIFLELVYGDTDTGSVENQRRLQIHRHGCSSPVASFSDRNSCGSYFVGIYALVVSVSWTSYRDGGLVPSHRGLRRARPSYIPAGLCYIFAASMTYVMSLAPHYPPSIFFLPSLNGATQILRSSETETSELVGVWSGYYDVGGAVSQSTFSLFSVGPFELGKIEERQYRGPKEANKYFYRRKGSTFKNLRGRMFKLAPVQSEAGRTGGFKQTYYRKTNPSLYPGSELMLGDLLDCGSWHIMPHMSRGEVPAKSRSRIDHSQKGKAVYLKGDNRYAEEREDLASGRVQSRDGNPGVLLDDKMRRSGMNLARFIRAQEFESEASSLSYLPKQTKSDTAALPHQIAEETDPHSGPISWFSRMDATLTNAIEDKVHGDDVGLAQFKNSAHMGKKSKSTSCLARPVLQRDRSPFQGVNRAGVLSRGPDTNHIHLDEQGVTMKCGKLLEGNDIIQTRFVLDSD
ncbi:hypothetical protein K438DRAFT_1749248 [Mycena galopus ATCC 62051]|nr:hypothetical protein K438DRAFT_1749248 [Mycena galopus ATCC 62051]